MHDRGLMIAIGVLVFGAMSLGLCLAWLRLSRWLWPRSEAERARIHRRRLITWGPYLLLTVFGVALAPAVLSGWESIILPIIVMGVPYIFGRSVQHTLDQDELERHSPGLGKLIANTFASGDK
jgi:fatty acid desaturase